MAPSGCPVESFKFSDSQVPPSNGPLSADAASVHGGFLMSKVMMMTSMLLIVAMQEPLDDDGHRHGRDNYYE